MHFLVTNKKTKICFGGFASNDEIHCVSMVKKLETNQISDKLESGTVSSYLFAQKEINK